ncbi:extended synaptotagmin-like protein 2 isoform c [Holotrichia oblita]|uniref:Extended synaptotagmin-like protein 2 isoform c n=1 Tax=Holotrichia oblita TaxID=644536 RepID=A0ACB9TDW6_HOLOL|nr:extended synaptotagmin-like protein 2 isoform c [Holotrichia oblita]
MEGSDEEEMQEAYSTKKKMAYKICRICYKKGYELLNLEDSKHNYHHKLSSCIPEIDIYIFKNTGLCKKCAHMLDTAFELRETCLKNEKKSRNEFNKLSSRVTQRTAVNNEGSESITLQTDTNDGNSEVGDLSITETVFCNVCNKEFSSCHDKRIHDYKAHRQLKYKELRNILPPTRDVHNLFGMQLQTSETPQESIETSQYTNVVPVKPKLDQELACNECSIAFTHIHELEYHNLIHLKKASVVGAIYLAGYMHWSVAWFITPVLLLVVRDQMRQDADRRRDIAKVSALTNEKDVILARINDLPAWVYFPDVERAEWLNTIIKQCWPNVNHYAREMVRDKIQPALAKNLNKMKLTGFKFERIILGSVLHGMLRVIMKPLITTVPIVGGLQLFFLNNPSLDFNLVGIADILDMPGLSDILRRIIIEQMASVMVLPNKFPIKLSDIVEAAELKAPEPEGVLRVHVVEAKNLMKKDIGMLGKGKSDPYAVITVGAQEFRTKTIQNTVDPKWDFWCEAVVNSPEAQFLTLKLWDWDAGMPYTNDDPLGRATVEVSNIVRKGQDNMWITLEQAKHGMVHIRLTWLTLSSNYSDLQAALTETQYLRVTSMSTALLVVFVDSAKNLPQARSTSQPDPFTIFTLYKDSKQTAVQMRTSDPVWEQGFTFLVRNPETDTFFVRIEDQKTNSELGSLDINLNTLSNKANLEIVKQPFALLKSGPQSKIILSLRLRILKSGAEEQMQSDQPESALAKAASIDSDVISDPQLTPTMKEATAKMITAETDNLPDDVEEKLTKETSPLISAIPTSSPASVIHRTPSVTSSSGEAGLGRIQLTLRYSVARQRLTVVVNQVA